MTEKQIEQELITKLADLKYIYRPDIRDRAALISAAVTGKIDVRELETWVS